jgi:hypothetical protein
MKLNTLVSKTLPALLLLSCSSTFAIESTEKFRVAVVKNTLGANNIVAGEYESSIAKISDTHLDFNRAMNLCVAQIKTYNFELAENSCTKAIDSMSVNASRGRHGKLLKALAYSNRGIAKHLNNKSKTAYDDFLMAKSLSEDKIINDNMAYFKSSIKVTSLDDSESFNAE